MSHVCFSGAHFRNSYPTSNLLDARQTGYEKGHYNQTALLNVIGGIDQRKVTISVLFDFSKAFDLEDHRILEMRDLNFSNQVIKWFHSYLTSRKQVDKKIFYLIIYTP